MNALDHKPRPPDGYAIVRSGEMRGDDLIWSWTTKEWIRSDSPEWVHEIPVEMCVAVAREKEKRNV